MARTINWSSSRHGTKTCPRMLSFFTLGRHPNMSSSSSVDMYSYMFFRLNKLAPDFQFWSAQYNAKVASDFAEEKSIGSQISREQAHSVSDGDKAHGNIRVLIYQLRPRHNGRCYDSGLSRRS
ncbi:hypothetical protein CERZMDRAFT_83423 [Cercospora zeae-maydis SCOH1-5]|uniref:Uncharacterized protein n=1 Tax=Cercospora zeae-maydis SCOH1-5 TaxID=717836 RepID=A0A6A6FKK6_9PEZI|nr:hypothetical protein CERZMDRAFT_83423 [Cercospora zeae-maydis SCOH1-5]